MAQYQDRSSCCYQIDFVFVTRRCPSLPPLQPCLCPDYDLQRPSYPDLPLPSSLESPALPASVAPEEYVALTPEPPGAAPLPHPPPAPTAAPEGPAREQAFRTEFNLIYTCSPLNANLGEGLAAARGPAPDRRLSQSEAGGFSPAEAFFSGGVGGQGLLSDAAAGSLSPYPEPHYSSGYPDHGTPPHPSNPPQKKKASPPAPRSVGPVVMTSQEVMYALLRIKN